MRQMTLAHQAEFQCYIKRTRREQFLAEMDAVMPRAELLALVAPHYSKGEVGRKPVGLDIMLRVYFLQQWFALSDAGVEDALYESPVLRRFAGIDLGRAPAPDETTILNFRHMLEEQGQTEAIHEAAPEAQDMTSRRMKTKAGVDQVEKRRNRTKARVRAKVEWPLRILKRVLGFTRVRYRGLTKNHEWLCAGFAFINLYQNRKRLARINLRVTPSRGVVSPPEAAHGFRWETTTLTVAKSSIACRFRQTSGTRAYNAALIRASLRPLVY